MANSAALLQQEAAERETENTHTASLRMRGREYGETNCRSPASSLKCEDQGLGREPNVIAWSPPAGLFDFA